MVKGFTLGADKLGGDFLSRAETNDLPFPLVFIVTKILILKDHKLFG
jgi:hypothetical protein